MQTPGTFAGELERLLEELDGLPIQVLRASQGRELQLHEVADELVEQDEARRSCFQDLAEGGVSGGQPSRVRVHHQRPAARLMGEFAPEGRDGGTVFLHHCGIGACLLSVEDEHACVRGDAESAERLLGGRQRGRLLRAVHQVIERQ